MINTKTINTSELSISGVPINNVICIGSTSTLTVQENASSNSVDATWNYNSNIVHIEKVFMYHTYMAKLVPISVGITNVTATYNGKQISFNLEVDKNEIYISPANHKKPYIKPDGKTWYTTSQWNEKKNMEIVANHLKSYLDNYWVHVFLTNHTTDQGEYYGRPEEARDWMFDSNNALYLALHSNAGAGGSTNTRGSTGYYNHIGSIQPLALSLVNAVDAILPGGTNRATPTIAGNYSSGTPTYAGNLGELRVPEEYNIASVLIENGFHDNPSQAAFLISNQQLLAETIGTVLVNYFNIPHR